ncbi:MAG: NAD-dependent epimerase/dehydratase family protein [Bacteroidota bacterium]|nr:NAD-dependent epimerase/dehydratase family protein [Bacteroidota bacterium]
MGRTAIILGASGLVGSEVLTQLLADKDASAEVTQSSSNSSVNSGKEPDPGFEKIKIFVRKPIAVKHPKLEQIIVDFDTIGNYSDSIKGDVIFCCMGTTIATAGSKDAFIKVDRTYPLEFAKIAKQNGVETFLLISSVGADKTASNFYLKVKGDIEFALEKLKFESLIIVRPSMLLGHRKESRFAESAGKVFMKLFSFAFIGKLKKYKAIQASAVAKAMIRLSKMKINGSAVFLSDELQQIAER